MSDADQSVIDQLEAKRARRQAPAHRPARGAPSPPIVVAPAADVAAPEAKDEQSAPAVPQPPPLRSAQPAATPRKARSTATTRARNQERPLSRPTLDADEPSANYAVRVRRTLDDLVAWRLAELRQHGVRSSKVEITEMLLWELADAEVDAIAERLRSFRAAAPRS